MLTALMTTDCEVMKNPPDIHYPSFRERIIIVVGGFGSGKTEVSVNLAKYLYHTAGGAVTIADLDLVNPYFRTREALTEMEALGIKVITPRGGQFYADLPILLPEIKGAIDVGVNRLILDVGGDAQGARALGSLSGEFKPGDYTMLMVLNSRRPLTSDLPGCLKTMARIERSAKLKFTWLISNSHMIEETDSEVISEGYILAQEVSRATGLPLAFISMRHDLLKTIDVSAFNCPILPLTRSMLKPWEQKRQ